MTVPSSSPKTSQTRSGGGTKLTFAGPVQLNRMEVTVHTNSEQYPVLQTSQYSSYIGTDGHLSDKPPRLGVEDDVECPSEEKEPHQVLTASH
jgi:hypothetical protein